MRSDCSLAVMRMAIWVKWGVSLPRYCSADWHLLLCSSVVAGLFKDRGHRLLQRVIGRLKKDEIRYANVLGVPSSGSISEGQ
jgi:hypothetical protein